MSEEVPVVDGLDVSALHPPEPDPAGEVDADAAAEVAASEPDKLEAVEDPQPAKKGMLAELIEERTLRKAAEGRLKEIAADPVLPRLTPEIRDAIADGRIVVQPKATTADARKTQLAATAERLRLYTEDANGQRVPDLEAADRVDGYMRQIVDEKIAPLQQDALHKEAQGNINEAVRAATAMGMDAESIQHIRQEFESAGPIVAQQAVAMRVWDAATGALMRTGKWAPKAAEAPKKDPSPAVVPSDAVGRRASTAASVKLSPALEKVYKDRGLDPSKTVTATRSGINLRGPIELET